MNPLKSIVLTIVTSLALNAALIEPARAVPITGNIAFIGTVTLNSPSAATATQVTAWHFVGNSGSPLVSASDGVFAPFAGTFAAFSASWTFGSGRNSLWSVGSGAFTFDLQTSRAVYSATSVSVTGSGLLRGAGFDDTFGSWSFTTQDPAAGSPPVFSFSAATGAVPDGGSTVAFLGLALAGVEGMRRRIKAARG